MGATEKPYTSANKMSGEKEKDKAKTHKLSLKGSSKLVAEFFQYSINTILFQRGVYPADDFNPVKKYGLTMLVSSDDQVKAYIKKIMGQLDKWMVGGKISKLVVVITSKDTGEHVERWQFDVQIFNKSSSKKSSKKAADKENAVPDTSSPHHPPRGPKQKSNPRSNRSSDRSPRPSPSCPNSTANVHSTCWYMPMLIARYRWSGA